MDNAKQEMKKLLNDVVLRIQKLNHHPREEQIPEIKGQITKNIAELSQIAGNIGGQIETDFAIFQNDLTQFLNVPEDRTAWPQLNDDAAILLNQLSFD